MTDAEIDEMQKEMNKEAGMDTDDGGIDMIQIILMVLQDIHKMDLQVDSYHQMI